MAKRYRRTQVKKTRWTFTLGPLNFRWLGIGVLLMVLGYVLMATAITDDPQKIPEVWNNFLAVTVAPFVLVIAYCAVVPYALWLRKRKVREEQAS